jgi:hypothetical protein
VGEVNPRSSMSVDRTPSLIRSTVISRRNAGCDEALNALEGQHWRLENSIQRAKVVVNRANDAGAKSLQTEEASR